jgi:MFS family permease
MQLRNRRAEVSIMSLGRFRAIYDDYPRQFWLLVGASFIDMVGNALIYPFLALFITDRFDVSIARVGVIFAVFSAAGVAGNTVGGALADHFGRKPVALTALVASALGNLALAFITDFDLLYVLAATQGVVGSVGRPAWEAMMADLLPEEQRAEGYGIIRMLFNVAVTFGPLIGGVLAGMSYVLLFGVDAATSIITAAILFVFLRETRPQAAAGGDVPQESIVQTFRGYGAALRDRVFMAFMLIGAVVWLVYYQMNSTLAVYLRDEHGIEPQGFGLLIGLNALMVVLMQFGITRWLRRRGYPAMLVMAAGTALYAAGFSMFGYVAGYTFFVLAMVIITLGEMLISPVAQATAARLAPDHMRGRYMAVLGFGFAMASGSGTWLAGQVSQYLGFEWVWYLAGVFGTLAAAGYVVMHYAVEEPANAPPEAAARDTVDAAA